MAQATQAHGSLALKKKTKNVPARFLSQSCNIQRANFSLTRDTLESA
jgi:hypothetical protein